ICVFLLSVHDLKPFFNCFIPGKNIKPIHEGMAKKWQYFIEECHLLIPAFIQALVLSIVITLSPFLHYLKLNLK
ncbi:MAG: hypothetical protein AAB287_01980, partial [Nitrospirota bacterium]